MSYSYRLGRQIGKHAFEHPTATGPAPNLSARPSVNKATILPKVTPTPGVSNGRQLEEVLGRPAEQGELKQTSISKGFENLFTGVSKPAVQKQRQSPPWGGIMSAVDYLHGGEARSNLGKAVEEQGFKMSPWPAAGNALLRERQNGQPLRVNWESQRPETLYKEKTINMPTEAAYAAEPFMRDYLGYPTLLNHEQEHLQQGNTDEIGKGREVAAVLGDLVFMSEQARQSTGKPVNHTIQLPSGMSIDADWAARAAREHGYFAGRSMQDLLQTPEGLSFTNRVLGGSGDYNVLRYR